MMVLAVAEGSGTSPYCQDLSQAKKKEGRCQVNEKMLVG